MEFFIYLSKSATILFLFYIVYVIVLRKDTFFTANRFYLLSGIVAALYFPLLTFTQTIYVEIPTTIPEVYSTFTTGSIATETAVAAAPLFNWWYAASLLYLVGVVYMLGQFVFQLSSLIRLLRKYPSKKHNGFVFVQIEDATAPFSFFNYIVYNPQFHSEEELQMILQHEQVHAAQWHSLDVLAAHILRAIQWLNPISWWYKKSLEANLEFIADDQTAQHVSSKQAYQLALVKASSALKTPVLTTNFYQSFIKKRIIMLNKDHSNKYNQLKLSLIIPVLGIFLWSFNTNEVVAYVETTPSEEMIVESIVPLSFSAETTNAQLDDIEDYFATNHPNTLVKIANRKRNTTGELIKFSFKTKFKGHDRFYTRFDRTADNPFITEYQMLVEEDGTLVVNEVGEKGVQLLITKENLQIMAPVVLTPESIEETVINPSKNTKGATNLGKNPLYIINNKSYRQDELPAHSEIRLDGSIKSYNKKEGFQKYGEKGKDGVLFFDGTTKFVTTPTSINQPPTKVTSEGTVLNTSVTSPKNLNSTTMKRIQFPITKNTTDAQLDAHAAEAKSKYGYIVSFTVDRNSNKEITGLKVTYSGNGNSGNISSSNGGPIPDSYFFIDDETGGAGFVNEGSEERMEEMRERMEVRKAQMEERREERNELRGDAMKRRKALLENTKTKRKGLFTDSISGKAHLFEERREIIEERQEEQRARMKEMRKKHKIRTDSVQGMTYHTLTDHDTDDEISYTNSSNGSHNSYAYVNQRGSNQLAQINHHDVHAIIIDKNTTDETLEIMKSDLKNRGIKFNFKRVKRNSKGQLTGIRLSVSDTKGNKFDKSVNMDNGEPIKDILIEL